MTLKRNRQSTWRETRRAGRSRLRTVTTPFTAYLPSTSLSTPLPPLHILMQMLSWNYAYTRCVMHKSLVGGWPWCPIHSLSWSCPLKIPLGCSQKAGKQIQMFSYFMLWLYKPPASSSLRIAQKRLAFPVLAQWGWVWPCLTVSDYPAEWRHCYGNVST